MFSADSTVQRSSATRREIIGGRLSRIGELVGWNWLTYNPIHFLNFHNFAVADADNVLDIIEHYFPDAQSFVDVGAGSGAYAAEARRRGHRIVACEHSRFGRYLARRQGVDSRAFDLTRTPPTSVDREVFDVAYCFEVAEDIPAPLGDLLVEFVSSHGREVLFTAAHPGQGGTGHINEQTAGYWQERFARHGKQLDVERTAAIRDALAAADLRSRWLQENAMVFGR
jgi:SAM-dependent methyltransferase